MAFTSLVLFFPTTKRTSAQDMNYTVVVLGGVLVFSLVWYYFPVYGGVHWFKGPVPNVDGYVTGRRRTSPRGVEGVAGTIEMEKGATDTEIISEVVPSRQGRDL
jgi:hypothetical protein